MFVATIVFKHFTVACLFSDIDECTDNPSVCSYQCCSHYTVACLFSDIDECTDNPSVCSYRCKNTHGGFECICAPGQVRLADRKSCAG